MALSTAVMIGRTLGRPRPGTGGAITAFATGGSIAGGQTALVGEQGPELFVPNQPGTILPNNPYVTQLRDTAAALRQRLSGAQTSPLVNQMVAGQTQPTAAPAPAPTASPTSGGASPALLQQMMGSATTGLASKNLISSADHFAAQGFTLPAEIPAGTPQADAYIKSRLQSARTSQVPQGTFGPGGAASPELLARGGTQVTAGQPGQGGLPGFPMGGGLPGQPGQQGQGGVSFAGINPQLMQALTGALTGQGIPQANVQAPGIDPQLMAAIQGQIAGQGMPSFQQVVEGTYEPWSALMDEQFNTAMTNTFEQMVSRGVLQSGEAQTRFTEMARQQGLTKGAYLGQLALDYSKERQNQIQSAIQQWGVLDANRASNQTTLTAANLQAAVQIQGIAMQTLTNLTTAMAQIGSAEKIAGADIASRERIAGMDIASRQQIAQMQTSMQQTVAQISAQAMLQAADFDRQTAHNNVTATMALEGIDWNRFLSDPVYAANVTNAIAIEKDIHLAIDQADAVDRQLPPVPGRA